MNIFGSTTKLILFFILFLILSTSYSAGVDDGEISVGYFNLNRVSKDAFGFLPVTPDDRKRAERMLRPLFSKLKNGIVFSDAVFVSPELNISTQIIDRIKNPEQNSEIILHRSSNSRNTVTFVTVNAEKIAKNRNFGELNSQDGRERTRKGIEEANQAIKSIADSSNIDFVIQIDQILFASDELDITNTVLNKIAGRIDDNPIKVATAKITAGYVNSQKLFRDSTLAIKSRAKLNALFYPRYQELKKMAEAEKSGSISTSEYNIAKKELDDDFKMQEKLEMRLVIDSANAAISEISKKENLNLVLQDAVWASKRMDITDRVIAAMPKD